MKKKKILLECALQWMASRGCLLCSVQRAEGALWLAGMALKTLQLWVKACSAPKLGASVRIDPIKAE